MAITFKKNGRPKKSSKALVKRINDFLGALDDSERDNYDFNNEVVKDSNRLEEIWNKISNPIKHEEKKESTKEVFEESVENDNLVSKSEYVDKDTGEVKSKEYEVEEKESNLVNNNIDNMADSDIVDEIIEESEGNTSSTTDEVPDFFNPLSEPIKQRSYNKQEQTDVGDIDEPSFEKQESPEERVERIEEESEESEEEEFEDEEEEKSKDWDNVTNEKMNDLDGKDKKEAAKQLVQTVLDGYEMLHELGKNFVKYPEDKLQEKIIKKEIDPTMEIPLDENGTTTNPVEFFQNFNEQAEEAISYDPEFGEKVRPAMERVFSKKGWGMTDEQYLLVAFGKDAAWKGVQIMTLKKTANGIMNTFTQLQKEKIEAIKKEERRAARSAPPVQPDSIVTPPRREPASEPRREEVYNEVEDEYEESEADTDLDNDLDNDLNQDLEPSRGEITPIH